MPDQTAHSSALIERCVAVFADVVTIIERPELLLLLEGNHLQVVAADKHVAQQLRQQRLTRAIAAEYTPVLPSRQSEVIYAQGPAAADPAHDIVHTQ